ncbi:hypothetical protein BH11ACT1_BH11ACT1_18160 [soil metagenome]
MTGPRRTAAPGWKTEGGTANQPGGLSPIVPTDADVRTDRAARDAAAVERFRDAYAVLVRGATVRRHLYLNLPAAERVVRRAIERGDDAHMVLVRLVPVRGGRDD